MRLAFWAARPRGGAACWPAAETAPATTTNDENATVPPPPSFDAERRRQVLARVQWSAILAWGPSRWRCRGTCGHGRPPAQRNRAAAAHPDAIAFVFALAACTGRLILESLPSSMIATASQAA
jgi:hypothetical protein